MIPTERRPPAQKPAGPRPEPTKAPPGPPPRPASSSPPPGPIAQAAALTTFTPQMDPPRIVLNAVEGWGKTTFGAYAESPAILMAPGETGYRTLMSKGLVPSVPGAEIESWPQLLATVGGLVADDQGLKTLVLDALGGFERLCQEHVCARDFNGDWSERGFASYQVGYKLSAIEWIKLLSALDRLRLSKGVVIVLLSHSARVTFKNPMGSDFDRYTSDLHDRTWTATTKWVDTVLFGNFFTVVEGTKGDVNRKGKGTGGASRVIYTERRDAFDAKNRYALEPVIDIPDDPTAVWSTVWSAITSSSKEN